MVLFRALQNTQNIICLLKSSMLRIVYPCTIFICWHVFLSSNHSFNSSIGIFHSDIVPEILHFRICIGVIHCTFYLEQLSTNFCFHIFIIFSETYWPKSNLLTQWRLDKYMLFIAILHGVQSISINPCATNLFLLEIQYSATAFPSILSRKMLISKY